jgi:ribosomal protein S18 acetylase RimI-like enzyme
MAEIIRQRRRDREALIAMADRYVKALSGRLQIVAAVVAGSVARGDFNVWSDVDVAVVARGLPDRLPDRSAVLVTDAPSGVQPVGFLPEEFESAWRKGNTLVREAVERGVVLVGDDYIRGMRGVEIREVRPEEYEEAGRVTASAWQEFLPADPTPEWEAYFARIADIRSRAARTVVLGAFEDEALLGTVTLEVDRKIEDDGNPLEPDAANVRMLGVAPGARRRGIGRALMEATMAVARARGKRVLTLNTGERMQAAVAMYEAMGFVREPDVTLPSGLRLQSYRFRLDETLASDR